MTPDRSAESAQLLAELESLRSQVDALKAELRARDEAIATASGTLAALNSEIASQALSLSALDASLAVQRSRTVPATICGFDSEGRGVEVQLSPEAWRALVEKRAITLGAPASLVLPLSCANAHASP